MAHREMAHRTQNSEQEQFFVLVNRFSRFAQIINVFIALEVKLDSL